MRPALFRRRELWWPTRLGALVIVVAVLGAVASLGATVQGLLTPHAPARGPDGRGARTLVIEGWLDAGELDRAIAVAQRGRYDRIITSGGPIEPWLDAGAWGTFAQRAVVYLRAHGPVGMLVSAAPAPETTQERTYTSAVAVRDWLRTQPSPPTAIDVLTAGVHARRSWLAYRLAFGHTAEVGIVTVARSGHDALPWWQSTSAAKATIGEVFGFVGMKCCFWPEAPAAP